MKTTHIQLAAVLLIILLTNNTLAQNIKKPVIKKEEKKEAVKPTTPPATPQPKQTYYKENKETKPIIKKEIKKGNENIKPAKQPYKKTIEKEAEKENSEPTYSVEQCYQFGENYYYGRNGVTQDYNEAFKWYRKAAEQGVADAQNSLGFCYYCGKGVIQDYNEAIIWFRKAAEQGNAIAQNNLGVCYGVRDGVTYNSEEPIKWLKIAAEQGNGIAQRSLGLFYESYYSNNAASERWGYKIEELYRKSIEWHRKSAEQGNAMSQYHLGNCYYDGNIVTQDFNEAVKWYSKAAEQGHIDAQICLGYCYYRGTGVTQDFNETVRWYRKAAKQGSVDAQVSLGNDYEDIKSLILYYYNPIYNDFDIPENGNADAQYDFHKDIDRRAYEYIFLGERKDKTYLHRESTKWLLIAAENGNIEAQIDLLSAYRSGHSRNVPKNNNEAVIWYSKVLEQAEQGNVLAQIEIGESFRYGQVVTESDNEAEKWYRKAAESGKSWAQIKLAFFYEAEKKYQQAAQWYRKAAEQGNAGGCYYLALYYLNRIGGEYDLSEAEIWLHKALELAVETKNKYTERDVKDQLYELSIKRKISGVVRNHKDKRISGATIKIKSSSKDISTLSGEDGEFEIKNEMGFNEKFKIEISYVGMESQTLTVSNGEYVQIKMLKK